jgi:H+-transporting ATPase
MDNVDEAIISTDEAKGASLENLEERLSSSKDGLSSDEAQARIDKYGYNEITEKKQNMIIKFLGYFWGPIAWMIEAAAVLSAYLARWEDFGIILFLLMTNAVVGFWQENKADNAIELLKQRLAPEARVKRDGKWTTVSARELVPGDIVRVRLGDIVPADMKLFNGEYLSIDESALTGESLPVEKHESDMGYSGSIIRQGEMDGLVFATGMSTYFGRTAALVEQAQAHSHFQKAVIRIGNFLIATAIVLVTVVVIVSIFRSEPIKDTIQFALILTVAAIPAALPAVLSITMAVGATNLAKKEAIVSRLASVEEMAGMEILCSDKTGTITTNELSIAEVDPFEDYSENDTLLYATLASREEDKDPIDGTIINKVKEIDDLKDAPESYEISGFKPFDPSIKRTEASAKSEDGKHFKVSKGAPQAVLSLLGEDEELEKKIDEIVNGHASKGYRSLGVARTNGENEWHYVGLIALYNPPRDDSAATLKTARDMGVEVKMITGDHPAVAKEIASEVGLGTNILSAVELKDKPDSAALKIVLEADGFAEVKPDDKYEIVTLLQEGTKVIVGMTGDGVNDAPALKQADAGIAVAGATDAAKSAADIVLTKPGLSVIIDAIKQSRMIFQRMNSYAIYRIAETIRVLFFVVAVILAFNFYPITAVMIVLLAVFNDIPIISIAYDNVRYSSQPEKWSMPLVLGMGTYLGILGVVFSFGLYYIGKSLLHLDPGELQSFIFLKFAVAGNITIFLSRTRGFSWSTKPGTALLWTFVTTKLVATLMVVFGLFMTAIGWKLAAFVWGYAIVAALITDVFKVLLYRISAREGFNLHP